MKRKTIKCLRAGPIAVLLLLSASALAQAQFDYSTNSDNTITITGYSGGAGDVTIPSTINGLPVASIGDFAFSENDELTNVVNVTIPNSVTNIGRWAFAKTSLTSVTIPGSVISIGDDAFTSCPSLTNATIGDSVTSIGDEAFSGAGLINVTIGNGVTNIADYAFSSCLKLTGVYFKGDAPAADSSVFVDPFFTFPLPAGRPTTVYYLPGTTGWNSQDAGLPAVLWNPLIQTGNGSFGVTNNQFGFNINWASGQVIVVEACTNLASPVWTPLQTNTLTNGVFYFNEPLQTNDISRFYRINSP